jgi:DNA-directed RNA polymerase specialized sigma24 family protein
MNKLPEIQTKYVGDPARYFPGVAKKIFLESRKEEKKAFESLRRESPPVTRFPGPEKPDEQEESERRELEDECLEQCMAGLSRDDRDLIIGYYGQEKRAKIKHRKEMADAHGSVNALRIWMCRKRKQLRECIEECIKKAQADEK